MGAGRGLAIGSFSGLRRPTRRGPRGPEAPSPAQRAPRYSHSQAPTPRQAKSDGETETGREPPSPRPGDAAVWFPREVTAGASLRSGREVRALAPRAARSPQARVSHGLRLALPPPAAPAPHQPPAAPGPAAGAPAAAAARGGGRWAPPRPGRRTCARAYGHALCACACVRTPRLRRGSPWGREAEAG